MADPMARPGASLATIAETTVETPVGRIVVRERAGRIVALSWGEAATERETPLLAAAAQQLNAYFFCGLKQFDLPVDPAGSAFHRSVWRAMQQIPYGSTRRYGDLAHATGSVARAVGIACARNPIPIIIPCHRVVAGNDRLGGFSGAGGTETKLFLLRLEGARLL